MTTRARITPGDGDPRHGTPNAYSNLRCRCDACRAANWDYRRPYLLAWKRRRGGLPAEQRNALRAASAQPCGTHAAYSRHRRRGETPCVACRAAEAVYVRERRAVRRAQVVES